MQRDILAITRHRFQLTHREQFTTLPFKDFLASVEFLDVILIRINDNLAARAINDNCIASLH